MLWTGLAGSFFASAAIVVSASPGALGASVGFFWSTRRMAWVVFGTLARGGVPCANGGEAPGAARGLSATTGRWEDRAVDANRNWTALPLPGHVQSGQCFIMSAVQVSLYLVQRVVNVNAAQLVIPAVSGGHVHAVQQQAIQQFHVR